MRGSYSTVPQWSVQVQYPGKCPVHYPEMHLLAIKLCEVDAWLCAKVECACAKLGGD